MTAFTLQHKDIPKGQRHGIVQWEFATIQERDDYVGIVAKDVHKVCYVSAGTGAYFAVQSVDSNTGTVTWASLGDAGGAYTADLSVGTNDISTLQIQSSNGTDVTLVGATTTKAGVMTGAQVQALQEVIADVADLESGSNNGIYYQHMQSTASSSWVINHTLGVRPNIHAYSVGGLEIEGELLHISTDQAQYIFDTPIAGYAICS